MMRMLGLSVFGISDFPSLVRWFQLLRRTSGEAWQFGEEDNKRMTGVSSGNLRGQMVSRKGVEPLTYGLGNRCSILLSYRDLPMRLANRTCQ
jgi:hypothetical protein